MIYLLYALSYNFFVNIEKHQAWSDYFPSLEEGTVYKTKFQTTSGRAYVVDCYFEGSGKAINCTGLLSHILIEKCIFHNVFDGNNAGCIYIHCNCHCKINSCCAHECYSTGGASFAFLFSSIDGHFEMNQTSIVSCGQQKTRGVVVCLVDGRQRMFSVNGSNNLADTFIFEQYISVADNLSRFCTFSMNLASVCCIYFASPDIREGQITTEYCNFFQNSGKSDMSSTVCLLESFLNLLVSKCIFLKNDVTYLFRSESGGKIVVQDSYIPPDSMTKTTGSVVINDCIKSSATIEIQHFSTAFCQANMPISGNLNIQKGEEAYGNIVAQYLTNKEKNQPKPNSVLNVLR